MHDAWRVTYLTNDVMKKWTLSSKTILFSSIKVRHLTQGSHIRVARDVPKAKRFSAYEPDADGEVVQQPGEDGIKEDVQNGLENQAHENAVQNGGENGIIEVS